MPLAVAFLLTLAASAWSGASAEPDLGPDLSPPGMRSIPLPPGTHVFGPHGPESGLVPSFRGRAAPPAEPQPRPGDEPVQTKAPTRKELLDTLFARLGKATDPEEAGGIATMIERMWMHSGSDTADLLMTRAVAAMGSDRRDVARTLLDKIVVLEPDWAEAWNKRATLRFLENDDAGSMEDISHVLTLEPRHFGALSGMGFILKRNGLDKGALATLRRALDLYPENQELRKAVDQLTPEVEGRDL